MRFLLGVMGAMVFAGLSASGRDLTPNELGERLVARRGTLSQGVVDFEAYTFTTSPEYYKEITAAAGAFDKTAKEETFALLRRLITERSRTKPSSGYKGTFYYRGGSYRLHREKIPGFGGSGDDLRKQAEESNARFLGSLPEVEEIVFDGETLSRLEGPDRLILCGQSTAADYPQLADFDISLGPWHMMIEKGSAPGQTITVSQREGLAVLRFESPTDAGKSSWVDYAFDPSRAYAPVWLRGEKDGTQALDALYGYDREAKDNCPRPAYASMATFKSKGYVIVDMWLIRQWTDEVKDAQLQLPLPEKYMVVDQRFGRMPLIYDEAGVQQPDFNLVPPADSGVAAETQATNNGERQPVNPIPPELSGASKAPVTAAETGKPWSALWIIPLACLALAVAVIMFARRKKK